MWLVAARGAHDRGRGARPERTGGAHRGGFSADILTTPTFGFGAVEEAARLSWPTRGIAVHDLNHPPTIYWI
jgi:hypothetical protein